MLVNLPSIEQLNAIDRAIAQTIVRRSGVAFRPTRSLDDCSLAEEVIAADLPKRDLYATALCVTARKKPDAMLHDFAFKIATMTAFERAEAMIEVYKIDWKVFL